MARTRRQQRPQRDPRDEFFMGQVGWHQSLAALHAAPADPDAAAALRETAGMTEAEAKRTMLVREDRGLRRAAQQAMRVHHVANVTEAPVNPAGHVMHALTAVQLQAVLEGTDIDSAVRARLMQLAQHENEGIAARALAHRMATPAEAQPAA